MKKILITIGLAALVTSSQAQGLVNFFNANATAVHLRSNSVPLGATPGTLGGFRYELFRGVAGTTDANLMTATGLIATNTATVGRFQGGAGVAIPGTALGGTAAIMIRGWSANLGSTYAAALANINTLGGFIGSTPIAPNFLLGGDGGAGLIPTSGVFLGSSGIAVQSSTISFSLDYVAVPEPTSMALAGLGAASLLIFRRRNK